MYLGRLVDIKWLTVLPFIGHLNHNELAFRIDPYITSDPVVERQHNQLIAAMFGNIVRDLPEEKVAPWVSANDKPAVLSKPVTGDAAEQRLKMEVMELPARDRRRIKEVPDVSFPMKSRRREDEQEGMDNRVSVVIEKSTSNILTNMLIHSILQGEPVDRIARTVATSMSDYHAARQVKLPDPVSTSGPALSKTNWDLEVRKRFAQPLFSESLDFPDPTTIQARMLPICYSESLPQGAAPQCAQYLTTATETFIKSILADVLSSQRSNISHSAVGGNVILTGKYKRDMIREEDSRKRRKLHHRSRNSFAAAESSEGWKALNLADLKSCWEIGGGGVALMGAGVKGIVGGWEEGVLEGWARPKPDPPPDQLPLSNGVNGNIAHGLDDSHKRNKRVQPQVNGIITNGAHTAGPLSAMAIDEQDWGWEGGSRADRERLNDLLDECLAAGQ